MRLTLREQLARAEASLSTERLRVTRLKTELSAAVERAEKAVAILQRLRNPDKTALRSQLAHAEYLVEEYTHTMDEWEKELADIEEIDAKISDAGFDDLDALIDAAENAEDTEARYQNLLDIESRRLTSAWRRIAELQATLNRCGVVL